MSDALQGFVAYLNGNPTVRSQVEHLERSLAAAFRQEAESMAALAVGAGFSVDSWAARPGGKTPTEAETLSGCCGFMTIGTEVVEEALAS